MIAAIFVQASIAGTAAQSVLPMLGAPSPVKPGCEAHRVHDSWDAGCHHGELPAQCVSRVRQAPQAQYDKPA